MARVVIDLPETFDFEAELSVRCSDVNHAGHMGNDALVSLANEARIRFVDATGAKALFTAKVSPINADMAVIYKAEAFLGDPLRFEVAASAFHKYGFDLVTRVSHAESGKEIAILKAGMSFFDYEGKKVALAPSGIRELLTASGGGAGE